MRVRRAKETVAGEGVVVDPVDGVDLTRALATLEANIPAGAKLLRRQGEELGSDGQLKAVSEGRAPKRRLRRRHEGAPSP